MMGLSAISQSAFFDQLFGILGIPARDHQQLRQDIEDIIFLRALAWLLGVLPGDALVSCLNEATATAPGSEAVVSWLSDHARAIDPDLTAQLNHVVEQAIRDCVGAFTQQIDAERKEEIIAFATRRLA